MLLFGSAWACVPRCEAQCSRRLPLLGVPRGHGMEVVVARWPQTSLTFLSLCRRRPPWKLADGALGVSELVGVLPREGGQGSVELPATSIFLCVPALGSTLTSQTPPPCLLPLPRRP
jgi:hypothetical protein